MKKLLPVQAAYTLLRVTVDMLSSMDPPRRKDLLEVVAILGEGFAHLVRSELPEQDRDFYLAPAQAVIESANRLSANWGDSDAYSILQTQAARLLNTRTKLEGRRMFENTP